MLYRVKYIYNFIQHIGHRAVIRRNEEGEREVIFGSNSTQNKFCNYKIISKFSNLQYF
jgi:hypothetical protein